MIANPGSVPGRRIDLVRGVATARPTSRLAGCACGSAANADEAAGPGPT
jgi:adenylyltransferase/sulfurtransferase